MLFIFYPTFAVGKMNARTMLLNFLPSLLYTQGFLLQVSGEELIDKSSIMNVVGKVYTKEDGLDACVTLQP